MGVKTRNPRTKKPGEGAKNVWPKKDCIYEVKSRVKNISRAFMTRISNAKTCHELLCQKCRFTTHLPRFRSTFTKTILRDTKKIVLRLKISFFRRELVACFRKGTIWIEWTSVSLFLVFGGHFTKLVNSA